MYYLVIYRTAVQVNQVIGKRVTQWSASINDNYELTGSYDMFFEREWSEWNIQQLIIDSGTRITESEYEHWKNFVKRKIINYD